MALHKAEHILVAILAALTSSTTAGTNVKRNRTHAWDKSIVDCIDVAMGADTIVEGSDANMQFTDSDLEVTIFAHSKNTAPETRLNLLKTEITVALMAARDLGLPTIVHAIYELGWSPPAISGEGETETAMVEGKFLIKYRRSITDPSA